MSKCLVIGDIHEPVSHPGYLAFCRDLQREYKTDTTVFIGDVVDMQAISFHANNPQCPGALDEFHLAKKAIGKWAKAFPKAIVTLGNHDIRVIRLAESVNIPPQYLRNHAEIWKTPGWEWVNDKIIDDVFYWHGTNRSGINPAFNVMKDMLMSAVIGHCHSAAGIKWIANPLRRTFGMDTGCGIDVEAFQFAYGCNARKRPILSAGVVIDGIPDHHIMPCGTREKYHRSRFI
jgi:predicted phosphodiesterase